MNNNFHNTETLQTVIVDLFCNSLNVNPKNRRGIFIHNRTILIFKITRQIFILIKIHAPLCYMIKKT